MISFRYNLINEPLIREVVGLVLDHGESVIVLGPRYGGKKHFITRVRQGLEKAGVAPLVQIDLPRQEMIMTADRLFELIAQAVNQAAGEDILALLGDETECPIETQLFSPLDKLAQLAERPVVMTVPHVDGMAHSLARLLLQAIRPRVQAGRIIAVLGGETDFRELVHGPKSEFNCANQYVLQGFDLDAFRPYVNHYAAAFNLRIENERAAEEHLWRLTGGNVHQLWMVFSEIAEARASQHADPELPLQWADLPDSLYKIKAPGVCPAEVFHHAKRLINREPDCWAELEKLLAGQPVRVHGADSDAPSRLELAGVVVREGDKLRITSPLMGDFLQAHYTPRSFGDLYAKNGDWEKAFDYYRQLKPEECLRPSSTDDRGDVTELVKSLCHALFAEAAKGVEDVKRLFVRGSHYVLGFDEISFWRRNGKWKKQVMGGAALADQTIDSSGEEYEEAVGKALPQTDNASPGLWPLPETRGQYGAIAVLPTSPNDRRLAAVIVCDYRSRVVISRERKLLIEELLKSFVSAYGHAISVEYERQRREIRDKHIKIINSVFEGLGYYIHNTKQMLAVVARELRKLSYKRVLFCLVDPERKRIQGVVDDAESKLGDEDVAALTDFPLDDPKADLHPYIIFTKQAEIIPDAAESPLTCKRVVSLAGMKAMAIVPILNLRGEAIGTIHIEREDDAVPTDDEVEDLKDFAGQLAVAVELCERVNLLQSAFDKIPEPVGIVDRLGKLRYANRPAAKLLSVDSGWRDSATAPVITEAWSDSALMNAVNQSLQDGISRIEHAKIRDGVNENNVEIVSAVIRDWGKRTVGAIGHIRDLSFEYQMFDAFRLVMNSDSPVESLLDALKLLGHRWGRLYLVDETDPNCFISKLCFGFKKPSHKEYFERGLVKIGRRDSPRNYSWSAIEKNSPLIFCFRRDLEDRSAFVTSYGLEAITINNPGQQKELEKDVGEFWLDLPIIGARERPLGKVTISWENNFHRDRLDLIKVLIDITAEFIQSKERREHSIKELEASTAEKWMGLWAHNIATRLASLPVVLAKYRVYERKTGELREVNKSFSNILAETLTTMQRVKERLAPVVAQCSELDLAEQVESTLISALPEGTWQFQCDERPFPIKADGGKLKTALLEMIQNSREIIGDDEKLRVNVALANGDGWAKLVYRDNGPGVPGEFKQEIFDEFFSRRPGEESSTGLGLSFVRRVVQAHGGKVEEKGQPGQGAEFVISLPKIA